MKRAAQSTVVIVLLASALPTFAISIEPTAVRLMRHDQGFAPLQFPAAVPLDNRNAGRRSHAEQLALAGRVDSIEVFFEQEDPAEPGAWLKFGSGGRLRFDEHGNTVEIEILGTLEDGFEPTRYENRYEEHKGEPRLVEQTSADGSVRYEYDEAGRRIAEVSGLSRIELEWDDGGDHLRRLTMPHRGEFVFGESGRLESMDARPIEWDGPLRFAIREPNGDEVARVTPDAHGSVSESRFSMAPFRVLLRRSVVRDARGNWTEIVETIYPVAPENAEPVGRMRTRREIHYRME